MYIRTCSRYSQHCKLQNDEHLIVIQEVTANGITVATNNKDTNLLTIEKYNHSMTELLPTEVLDLNLIAATPETQTHLGNGDVYQHTFSNREFDRWNGSPNEWKCRIPNSIIWVDETSSNEADLREFANCVQEVNEAEIVIIGAVGGTAAATAIAAFLTGGTAAGAAAAGGGASIVAAFANLNSACNKADLAFSYI